MRPSPVKLDASARALEQRIGHRFARPALLVAALTHGSRGGEGANERLEFLGDRVLGLVIAHALLQADPDSREGVLAPRFNALVRREACAEVARDVGLGDALKLGRSEMLAGGRKRDAMLADAMEAVIAAVFLDAGFEAARGVVLRLWGDRVAGAPADARDAKTSLQEWAQARALPPPAYEQVAREGPDHAPRFVIEARLATGENARAAGASKRAAEHAAAAALLAQVDRD